MQSTYLPQPVNTDHINLPEELNDLIEAIAQNVHEVWAQSRMSQGWVYGPERNDVEKIHPCLVPYEALSEEEKAYDRSTALSTLKFICHNGFKIEKQEL